MEIGGERIDLVWHGSNHSPDNIFIHLPDHETLMLVDIVNPGWAPIYQSNLTEDVQGYIKAPDTALSYSWKHFIGRHMGELGTREDIALHQQYMADIAENSRNALDTVDPTPYFVKYGEELLGCAARLPGRHYGRRPQNRSSRSTPAPWRPLMCSPQAPRSTSCSRSASTSATARRFTPERVL